MRIVLSLVIVALPWALLFGATLFNSPGFFDRSSLIALLALAYAGLIQGGGYLAPGRGGRFAGLVAILSLVSGAISFALPGDFAAYGLIIGPGVAFAGVIGAVLGFVLARLMAMLAVRLPERSRAAATYGAYAVAGAGLLVLPFL